MMRMDAAMNRAPGRQDIGSAVSPYRPKFTDCPACAVANSYPNVDLLWDSVIAGPWGWPRSTVQARVPARRLPLGGSGTLNMSTG
jgi:hypothetical protein